MKEADNEHINSNTPNLNKLGKKHGFEVPKGYFDSFDDRLMARIAEEEEKDLNTEKQTKTISLTKKPTSVFKPLLMMAASMLLLLAIGNMFYGKFFNQTKNIALSAEDIELYMMAYPDEFEEDFLIEGLQLANNERSNNLQDEYSDEIIDYLLEENIDPELLLN